MVHAKEGWNKRNLTDESSLHLGTGCKIEDDDFKDQPNQTKQNRGRKHKAHQSTKRDVPGY